MDLIIVAGMPATGKTTLAKKTAGILYCRPLQDTAHRHMEGCRINYLEDARIEDAALPQ